MSQCLIKMSQHNVSSKCLIKMCHQNVSSNVASKCLIKISQEVSHKNVSSNVSSKCLIECLIKMSHQNVSLKYLIKMFHLCIVLKINSRCCSSNIIHDLCLRVFSFLPLLIILLLFELVTKHAWLFITYYGVVGDSWIVLP